MFKFKEIKPRVSGWKCKKVCSVGNISEKKNFCSIIFVLGHLVVQYRGKLVFDINEINEVRDVKRFIK